jgi:hypothetical protein
MLHSHLRLREDRGLLALGPCLPLPSPRRPPINTLHITAVGITSPAANISSNTLTASSIRPLLHHQRSPWRSQGRCHRVPASRVEAPLRTAGPCAGARRRLLRPCRIAPVHARTARVLGPHGAAAHASESVLRGTACSGPFASAPRASACPCARLGHTLWPRRAPLAREGEAPGAPVPNRWRRREREKTVGIRLETREGEANRGKKKRRRQIRIEQRGRTSGILQGCIRKIRELQGPTCKTKFPVDLKLK